MPAGKEEVCGAIEEWEEGNRGGGRHSVSVEEDNGEDLPEAIRDGEV